MKTVIKIKADQYVSAIPRMTPELEKMLGIVERDIKKNKNFSPIFSNVEEILAYLNKL